MTVFLELLIKLLPLYITMGLGYLSARWFASKSEHFAGLMLYIITPIVFFSGVMGTPLKPEAIFIPLLVWCICLCNCLLFYQLGRRLFRDSRANILSLVVATGNTGYFGIPVALLLFGEDNLSIYITCMFGTALFENSMGYYMAAKGYRGARESFLRVLRLPSLYAFFLGFALNINGFQIPALFDPFVDGMRGTYSILGMMLIGMSMAGTSLLGKDHLFTGLSLIGKFVCWPIWIGLVIWLDSQVLHLFSPLVYQSLFLVAIVPVAANTVVIAILVKANYKQVAAVTLLSTLVGLFYIPLMTAVWM